MQHAVHVQFFQLAAQVAHQLLLAHACQVTQADHGVGAAAHAQEGEFEPLIVEPAADEREVGHKAFGEALARAGEHALVFRLAGRPYGKPLGVDHDRPRVPLGKHDRVAVQEGGEQLIRVGLDAAVVHLQDGARQLVGRGLLAVRTHNRPDDALVDGDVVDHAVEKEYRTGKPILSDGTAGHKGVVALEDRLHQADIAFEIGGKSDLLHGFTP